MNTTYTDPISGRSFRLPALTPDQLAESKARMQALADRIEREGDAAIDYSDIPELTAEDFARAIPVGRPRRSPCGTVPITVRLDRDVVAWLKRGGRGYQTRLNALVRAAMGREA